MWLNVPRTARVLAVGVFVCTAPVTPFAQQPTTAVLQERAKEGERALAEGRYAEAEKVYQTLRQLSPGTAEVHARLGLIYFQQGKFSDAVPPLREAVRLKPGLPNVDSLLAMSLSELGKYEEALPVLEKTFSESADPVLRRMAGLHLQRTYTGLGRDRDAVEVALRLSRLHPDDPAAYESIIGRAHLDDLEAILAVADTDLDEVEHAVKDNADTIFTSDHAGRARSSQVYEKARPASGTPRPTSRRTTKSTSRRSWGDRSAIVAGIDPEPLQRHRDREVGREGVAGTASNRTLDAVAVPPRRAGSAAGTAKITETVPWYDAKLYAATQVVDEARHVEVFPRYLDEKLGGGYQSTPTCACCSTTSSRLAAGT